MTLGSFHFLDGSSYAIKQFGTPMLNTWKLHVSCGTSLLQSGNSNIFSFFNISIRYIIKCLFSHLVTNFIFSDSVEYMEQIKYCIIIITQGTDCTVTRIKYHQQNRYHLHQLHCADKHLQDPLPPVH